MHCKLLSPALLCIGIMQQVSAERAKTAGRCLWDAEQKGRITTKVKHDFLNYSMLFDSLQYCAPWKVFSEADKLGVAEMTRLEIRRE